MKSLAGGILQMNFTAKNLTHETKEKVLKTIKQNIHIW